jgi:anti-sigma regulatory factor (Ser/Thr protein kinase)
MVSQGHDVRFYERDSEIVDAVEQHALECLRNDIPVLVVATPEHRAALEADLTAEGVDLPEAQKRGRYLAVDAADVLLGLMVGNHLDPDLFDVRIGALLDSVHRRESQTWVYGEMVALLCADGNIAGAMEVEAMWNDLAATRNFSLLCGYPTSMLDSAALEQVAGVCESHTHVVPPSGYRSSPTIRTSGEPLQSSKVFVPAGEAIAAARSFVADALRTWGAMPPLIDDAMLLTSEMATNALVHAHSPFRISVARADGVISFAVQDATSRTPQKRNVDAQSAMGRGMGIVDALSSRWGCDVLPTGKVVWAELLSPA